MGASARIVGMPQTARWAGTPSIKGRSESTRMALLTFSLVGLQCVLHLCPCPKTIKSVEKRMNASGEAHEKHSAYLCIVYLTDCWLRLVLGLLGAQK